MSKVPLYRSAINKNNILLKIKSSVWIVSIMLKSKSSARNAEKLTDEQNVLLCSVHKYWLQTGIVVWIDFELCKELNNSISLALSQRSLRNAKKKQPKQECKVFAFLKMFPSLKFYFMQSRSLLGYPHEIRFCLHLAQTTLLIETEEKGLVYLKSSKMCIISE